MKKGLYIGHFFHKKTQSTKFFIDILEKHYSIDFFWTSPFHATVEILNSDLIEKEYDFIVFFQIILLPTHLDKFKCRNLIIIPMYDNDLGMTYANWSEYYKYKFIHFSKSLYNKLDFLGVNNSLYLQYAPKVEQKLINENIHDKVNIFFWQRSDEINWGLIKQIIAKSQINSIHMHRIEQNENRDLWFKKPSSEDIANYNITFSSWFETKNELLVKLQECDVFIAPRLYEGIGQAFLEAMAYGKCVLAPDTPTMNEYITHNVNGILFNPRNPSAVNLSDYKRIGENAKQYMQQIRLDWEDKQEDISTFINKSLEIKQNNDILENNIDKIKDSLGSLKFILDDFKMIDTKNKISLIFSKYLNLLLPYLNDLKKENNIVIYGAGTGAQLILSIMPNSISFLVDRDESKDGTYLNLKPIYKIDKLKDNRESKIIISVFGRSQESIKYLMDIGIKRSNIISLDVD